MWELLQKDYTKDSDGGKVHGFKGVAKLNGRNTRFKVYFVINDDGLVYINEIYINSERRFFRPVKVVPKMASLFGYNTVSYDDILAAVYIVGSNINGWTWWKYFDEHKQRYRMVNDLR